MLLLALLTLLAPDTTLAEPPETPTDTPLDQLIARLGDDDYRVRENATSQILAHGPGIRARLDAELRSAADPEIRRRLHYILANITPPTSGVVIADCRAGIELRPGDLVTHVGGRRVHDADEFRQRLRRSGATATLRVNDVAGPRDLTDVNTLDIHSLATYRLPNGPLVQQIIRRLADGYVEQAQEQLETIVDRIDPEELSGALQARIAYAAGDQTAALALLREQAQVVHPVQIRDDMTVWTAPSELDLAGPGRAPLQLEWELWERLASRGGGYGGDPDLRVQRVLVPGRRYEDALVRAVSLWLSDYRQGLDREDATLTQAGNMLAVISWMCAELDLKSECLRLIEPRSAILRRPPSSINKWVRVDTDTWLPFFDGDSRAALDAFYSDAIDILARPLSSDDSAALTQNPDVAARVAFFLYQFPDDERCAEVLRVVNRTGQRGLSAYAHWMCRATRHDNSETIRDHLGQILPNLPGADQPRFAHALALLEYTRETPRQDVLQSASDIARRGTTPRDARLSTEIRALAHLAGGRVESARAALADGGIADDTHILRATAAYLERCAELGAIGRGTRALVARPFGKEHDEWLVVTRDGRLFHHRLDTDELTPIAAPTPSWLPGPLNWPWVGREPASGRVWSYDLGRVIEVAASDAAGLRVNIRTRDIAVFGEHCAPVFSLIADALGDAARIDNTGEPGPLRRAEIRANHEYTVDPALPEIGWLSALRGQRQLCYLAFRGGPHMLIESETGRAWSSRWLAGQLELDAPPMFIPRTTPDPESPLVYLFSDQGLIRLNTATEEVARIALPGDESFPPVIPEDLPYERRDTRWVYAARTPSDGGAVYRLRVTDDVVEPVDIVNLVLPAEYHASRSRVTIRTDIDRRLAERNLPPLHKLIDDVVSKIEQWDTESTP